jgi:hypothetical protein
MFVGALIGRVVEVSVLKAQSRRNFFGTGKELTAPASVSRADKGRRESFVLKNPRQTSPKPRLPFVHAKIRTGQHFKPAVFYSKKSSQSCSAETGRGQHGPCIWHPKSTSLHSTQSSSSRCSRHGLPSPYCHCTSWAHSKSIKGACSAERLYKDG